MIDTIQYLSDQFHNYRSYLCNLLLWVALDWHERLLLDFKRCPRCEFKHLEKGRSCQNCTFRNIDVPRSDFRVSGVRVEVNFYERKSRIYLSEFAEPIIIPKALDAKWNDTDYIEKLLLLM